MKQTKILCFFIVIFFFHFQLHGQTISPQLQLKLNKYEEDATKFIQQNENQKAGEAYFNAGQDCFDEKVYNKAIEYFEKSANLYKQSGNKNGIWSNYISITEAYDKMKNYQKAYNYALEAYTISKSFRQTSKQYENAQILNDLALNLNKKTEAVNFAEDIISIARELQSIDELMFAMKNASDTYRAVGNNDKATDYLNEYNRLVKEKAEQTEQILNQRVFVFRDSMENTNQQLILTSNDLQRFKDSLAEVILNQLEKEKELEEANKNILEKEEKIKDEEKKRRNAFIIGFIGAAMSVVLVFLLSQQRKAAQILKKQKLQIQSQSVELEKTNQELGKLSIVAEKTDNAIIIMSPTGDFEWVNAAYTRLFGYTFSELLKISTNVIGDDTPDNIKKIIQKCIEEKITVSYEFTSTTKKSTEVAVQATITPILDAQGNLAKLVLIDSDITQLMDAEKKIRQQRDELELQNVKIEQQNNHIRGSIRSASLIQNAILPPNELINSAFDNFIIYLPKDVVSGDFYWFSEIAPQNSQVSSYMLAVVDCSGHGVPGAFMSMIGNRILNEIVLQSKITCPSEVLENLDRSVENALREGNDGMDVCLCLLHKYNNGKVTLEYAGAKRPLYLLRKNAEAVETIDATRRSIGYFRPNKKKIPFAKQILELSNGDTIYLTTDGIIDQNGLNRTRYGSLKLVNIIQQISGKNMQNQKLNIIEDLKKFQSSEEQRDDITVIGIKI
jgi:PAS domain S-box-containing protein